VKGARVWLPPSSCGLPTASCAGTRSPPERRVDGTCWRTSLVVPFTGRTPAVSLSRRFLTSGPLRRVTLVLPYPPRGPLPAASLFPEMNLTMRVITASRAARAWRAGLLLGVGLRLPARAPLARSYDLAAMAAVADRKGTWRTISSARPRQPATSDRASCSRCAARRPVRMGSAIEIVLRWPDATPRQAVADPAVRRPRVRRPPSFSTASQSAALYSGRRRRYLVDLPAETQWSAGGENGTLVRGRFRVSVRPAAGAAFYALAVGLRDRVSPTWGGGCPGAGLGELSQGVPGLCRPTERAAIRGAAARSCGLRSPAAPPGALCSRSAHRSTAEGGAGSGGRTGGARSRPCRLSVPSGRSRGSAFTWMRPRVGRPGRFGRLLG
jgi:hypothetical protein